tara:strand:- start:2041 stop:2820 length:780 start_codon:yes stop_codon:yes gene_type:complete
MEAYVSNYDSFTKEVVFIYDEYGGIADYVKYFVFFLEICIKNNTRLYYLKTNKHFETHLMLTHDKMYITYENYQKKKVNVKYSKDMYKLFTWSGISLKLNDVFKFSIEVIKNSSVIFSRKDNNYITIHIRLGDSNLEINKTYIMCKNDNRICDNEKLYKYIENNKHETILITSDNKAFKLHIKDKYDNVVVTKCNIGHVGLKNTTQIQVLDTLTELYIMSLSKKIIVATDSGFSVLASYFNRIPIDFLTDNARPRNFYR